MQIEIVAVEGEKADHIRTVYERYGKGFHPARLNFGDCFAYALAETRDCPLLYVGNDFTRTRHTASLIPACQLNRGKSFEVGLASPYMDTSIR